MEFVLIRAPNTTEWRFILRDGVDVIHKGPLCPSAAAASINASDFQRAVASAPVRVINRDTTAFSDRNRVEDE